MAPKKLGVGPQAQLYYPQLFVRASCRRKKVSLFFALARQNMEGFRKVPKDKEEDDMPRNPHGEREAELQALARSGFFSSFGEAVEGNEDDADEPEGEFEAEASDPANVVVPPGAELNPSILDCNLPEEIRCPEGQSRGERFRRFLFTCNNFKTDDDNFPVLFGLTRCEPRIKYFVAGRELAPTTGTPHLQGYFEVANPMSIAQLQKWPCFAGQGLSFFRLVKAQKERIMRLMIQRRWFADFVYDSRLV